MLRFGMIGFGALCIIGAMCLWSSCGDDKKDNTNCANGQCDTDNHDSETGNDTGNDSGEDTTPTDTETALDSEGPYPENYDTDQYGNPAAACDPLPTEIVLKTQDPAVTEDTGDTEANWVAQCENRFGLQGSWYQYSDQDNTGGGNSTIEIDYANGTSGKICTSGIASKVLYEDYGKYWGAGIGIDLCASGGTSSVKNTLGECTLFDPRTKIIGFRITVEDGLPIGGGQLRIQFAETNRSESTYIVVDKLGTFNYFFEEAAVVYAEDRGDTDVEPIHPELVESLQFQISTVVEVDTTFDFCVSDIMPILAAP